MKYLGIFLVVAACIIAAAWGIFRLGQGFFLSDIPLPIRIAVPALILGLVLWLVAWIREKFKESEQREAPLILDRNIREMDEREIGRERR